MSIYIQRQLQKSQKHFGMPSTLSKPSFISFNELIPGSEGVRYTDINGLTYMSIRDIIMAVCGKDNNDAGRIWRNLPETYKNEVQQFLLNFKFPGRGQSEQPVITLQGALKLIMWLPGNMAKDFRSKACDILTRFLAGDASLHAEIEANAQSSEPINEFARASMPEPTEEQLENRRNFAELKATLQANIIQQQNMSGIMAELTIARQERDKERHMRHQADGRYGSEIREANQMVRKEAQIYKGLADMFEARMVKEQDRCDIKDQQLSECHVMLFQSMASRKRARSPSSSASSASTASPASPASPASV